MCVSVFFLLNDLLIRSEKTFKWFAVDNNNGITHILFYSIFFFFLLYFLLILLLYFDCRIFPVYIFVYLFSAYYYSTLNLKTENIKNVSIKVGFTSWITRYFCRPQCNARIIEVHKLQSHLMIWHFKNVWISIVRVFFSRFVVCANVHSNWRYFGKNF